ncbi:hypothetical protein [Exiguobacterium sp. s57]|uniref:hypothetical protein n=1 Tax=Exiguobacterium sp. s57 TaxID=2751258 RepID=UPI001BE51B8D|nr:hypothetical protein [Exiguobacterium sp. s57]
MDKQFEEMQTRMFELESQVEMLQSLLFRVIEQDSILHNQVKTELEYVLLKHDLPVGKRHDVSFFLIRLEKAYKFENKIPTFASFHEELKLVLELEELSEEVSVRLIQEYVRRGVFTVGNMIKYK